MRTFPTSVFLAIAIGLAAPWHDAVAAEPGSCYGGAVPAPPVRRQTIVLIDRTTASDRDVAEAFVSAAIREAALPGQRFVVLTFAALGPDQTITKHFDRVLEAPITDADQIENLPIRPFRTAQRCVKTRAAEWPRQAEAAIRAAMGGNGDPTRFRRSEIVYALNKVLTTFEDRGIQDTRLLMLSDAYENGSLGVSMYGRNGSPRPIDARDELGRLAPEIRTRGVRNGTLNAVWFGLMSEDGGRQDRYFDVRSVQQVRAFWEHLLVRDWGVSSAVIDRIPLNPFDTADRFRADLRAVGLRRDAAQAPR